MAANSGNSASYVRDVNLDFVGDDYSNPSASSSAYQANPYRSGDYYTVSGKSATGLSTGKILIYGGLALAGYWLYKRVK